MDVGAPSARRVNPKRAWSAVLRLESGPGSRLSAAERRWWPLTDLPVLIGAIAIAFALPAERPFDPAAAAALLTLYVVAYHVKVPMSGGWATAVQPVLVAMLVLEPARIVPLMVIAGSLLAELLTVAARRPRCSRIARLPGNHWFALPPAVLIAAAPQPVEWQWWAAAFLAGFTADAVMGRVRELTSEHGPGPWRVHLTPPLFDAVVTLPVLFTCLQARGTAAAWVVPVSLVAMSALVARERDGRVQSEELAGRDSLTGLANQRLFDELLVSATERAARSGQDGAVMIVDLDNFKAVNDTYGHPAGHEVLREVARRLSAIVRAGDEVARVGGDEFALLLADADGAQRVSEALAAALAEPILVTSQPCVIGASAGWATFGAHRQAAEAVEEADRSMYARKRSNGARG